MDQHRRRTAVTGRYWLSALLSLSVMIAARSVQGALCNIVVGPGSTVSLGGVFTVDCVVVLAGGTLNLKSGSLTITQPGGLVCDGTFNVGTAGNASLVLSGLGFPASTVAGTLHVLPSGTLVLNGGPLSVLGSLEVDGVAEINAGGVLVILAGTSSAGGSMTVAQGGVLLIQGLSTFEVSGSLDADGEVGIAGNGTLVLSEDGTLSVGGMMTLDDQGSLVLANGGTSIIDGDIVLIGDLTTLAVETADHTLAGSGMIEGRANLARLTVEDRLTLTSRIAVVGALRIEAGAGTFVNDGVVEADENAPFRDTLALVSGTYTGNGEYRVTASGAKLRFGLGVVATGIAADFHVSGGGVLDIDENVTTTGKLKSFTGAGSRIEVAGGKSVKFGQ